MKTNPQDQFEQLLHLTERPGGGRFSSAEIDLFSLYYKLVLKWNQRLHLTTITEPREFLDRHLLESAFTESKMLASIREVWDLGTGLGIPGIPIAILRPEIRVNLVEANRAKAVFLDETVFALKLSNVKVICARFETLSPLPQGSALTARAVDKMEKYVTAMIKLGSHASQLLFLGSSDLAQRIDHELKADRLSKRFLLPNSENRFLIAIERRLSST